MQIAFTSIVVVLFFIIFYNAVVTLFKINDHLVLQNTALSLSNFFFNKYGEGVVFDKQEIFGLEDSLASDHHFSLKVKDLETGESKSFGEQASQAKVMVVVRMPCLLKTGLTHSCEVVTRVWR